MAGFQLEAVVSCELCAMASWFWLSGHVLHRNRFAVGGVFFFCCSVQSTVVQCQEDRMSRGVALMIMWT